MTAVNEYRTLLSTIGQTPLVKLQRISDNPLVTLLAKLEFFNPSGSIKDRIVKYIIDEAEKSGQLTPGGTIIENTSGNTGAAVAMIAAIRGYRAILTMPDKVSLEKQKALKAFGAKVIITPTDAPPDSPEHYVQRAIQLAKETPNSFRINQYDNPQNPEAHYLTTGPEIWKQTKGKIDYFVASGSTGGTISGVSRYLKKQDPSIKTIMPDPIGSIYFEYYRSKTIPKNASCTYLVEGIGEDHIAHAMDFSLIDDVIQVSDKDSFATARRLAEEEGLLAGGSSGSNVWGALQIANQCQKPTTIVTIIPDGGIKYLSKFYDNDWMHEHHLM